MDGQEGRGYMRKLCEMSLLILALLLPFPVFAAGQEKVMGTVQIQCFVDLSLDGQTMELMFEEQDTGEEVTVASREYKNHAIIAQMPVGTYRLSAIRFNDNLYFDYRYSCSPETFSVTGEEQTEPVYVFAVGRSEAPKAVTSKIVFSGQEKFSGTVQITLHAVLDVYYGDTVTYRQEDYSVTSVGASEKTVDLDAGTYEITGINAYDEKQEPVTVYYPKYFTVDRNAMQKPEIALLVGEQDTAGTELVCKAAQEMDAYRYVADQKMELPYEAVTGQTDVIDQILASSGGTQESDKKAETSEQTRTEESGDAMKDIVPEKQVTRKWLLPAGIGMACAVCLVLVRKRSFRS